MNQPKKKYLSEFAINLFSAGWIMIPAHQLMSDSTPDTESQDIANNSHIYVICRTPALSFSKESISYKNGNLSGHINYKVNGETKEKGFSLEFPMLDGAVGVKCSDYPHREIWTYDENGENVRYLSARLICVGLGLHRFDSELSDLEVLYVGQAYGDGSRSAYDRLKSHSTLQKILAQASYDSPDSEIMALTFVYHPYRVISNMDSRAKDVISDYRDIDRFRHIMNTPLSEHQQICLIEAGLIRYFQPRYNSIYKENFPSESHKILASSYDLDFSGLIVEIDTEDLDFNLYSKNVQANSHHIAQIDILDPEKRWGVFHYSNGDGSAFRMPEVIQRAPKL